MSSRGYQLLPTTIFGNTPKPPPMAARKLLTIAGMILTTLLIMSWVGYPSTLYNSPSTDAAEVGDRPHSLRIAKINVQGQKDLSGRVLVDLGQSAEEAYDPAGVEGNVEGAKLFFNRLREFVTKKLPAKLQEPMLHSLKVHMPPSLSTEDDLDKDDADMLQYQKPMTAFRNIFQTDNKPQGAWSREWAAMNKEDGWVLDFYDDDKAQQWVDDTFGDVTDEHSVKWAYHFMHRGVLKADFLRYLLPLVKGGFYADTDTRPRRPIIDWGKLDVEYYDISATDGDEWYELIADEPAVMVGVDLDVHEITNYRELTWMQPLGICQWALSSAPYHPIMQDITRRIVNNTEYVRTRREQDPKYSLEVLSWTGPVTFTNAVTTYLLARYQVPWQHLRGRRTPLRIGEVMILPITAFSPNGEPDFGAETDKSPQCDLVHLFKGSWKGQGN